MKNIKIYTRLLASFAIVIVLAIGLGVVGMLMTSMISDCATTIYEKHVIGVEYLSSVRGNWDQMEINMLKAAGATGNAGEVSRLKANFDTSKSEVLNYLTKSYPTIVAEETKVKLREFESAVGGYASDAGEFFTLCGAASPNKTQIDAKLAEIEAVTKKLDGVIAEVISMKGTMAASLNDDTDSLSTTSTVVEIALLVVVIGFSAFVALFIATGIENTLKTIIDKLQTSASNINSSATQLSDASENLAMGSSRQAAAIEETSATMNETASMVQQNAENTRVASQLAEDSNAEMGESKQYMEKLMKTMTELKESSDKVSKIVKTIDGIASQTNLLAINATVEAARAGGDAGRSFAVVAQEVRSLAQRSAEASGETAEIIEKNIALTETSRTVAEKTLKLEKENSENISNLGKLISEINAASEEQASGIKQINIAVSQMEKVTQENAAVAEENAASSNSMKDEIGNLEEAVEIAKSLIRSSNFPNGTYAASANRSASQRPAAPKISNSVSTVSKTAPSAQKTAHKEPASTTSSAPASGGKTEAEKIIPLDDNDDF